MFYADKTDPELTDDSVNRETLIHKIHLIVELEKIEISFLFSKTIEEEGGGSVCTTPMEIRSNHPFLKNFRASYSNYSYVIMAKIEFAALLSQKRGWGCYVRRR